MAAAPIRIPGIRFEHLIGMGGMSEVWLGFHGGLNKEVAIKVMFKEAAESGEDVRQFMLESRVMERINHPGIVHSYEADSPCCSPARRAFRRPMRSWCWIPLRMPSTMPGANIV